VADLLTVRNLRAGYGETVVLEDMEISLAERGTLAVLGRNGVGKTTLLATIMGHTTLHSGEIAFSGRSIQDLPVHRRSRLGIGFVPQAREIFPSLSVEENLTVAARSVTRARVAGIRERAGGRWSLPRVYDLFPRLAERRSHMGNQISGGEQQMLAIGRALMGNPVLLLMDEPFEGLAPIIVETLSNSLRRLIAEDSLAMVLVEQSARLALEMTEAAIVLDRGRVAYSGRSRELLDDPERLAALFVAQ
jgi:branched-chain amino acid transport system ATP-binding protein